MRSRPTTISPLKCLATSPRHMFRRNAHNLATAYIQRVLDVDGVDRDRVSVDRIRFAFQVMYGVLNNTLSNRPGPFVLESDIFPEMLQESVMATMKLPKI